MRGPLCVGGAQSFEIREYGERGGWSLYKGGIRPQGIEYIEKGKVKIGQYRGS